MLYVVMRSVRPLTETQDLITGLSKSQPLDKGACDTDNVLHTSPFRIPRSRRPPPTFSERCGSVRAQDGSHMRREAVLRRSTTSGAGEVCRKLAGAAQGRKPDRDRKCRRGPERSLGPRREHCLQADLFNGKQVGGSIARVLRVRTAFVRRRRSPHSGSQDANILR